MLLQKVIIDILIEVSISLSILWSQSPIAEKVFQPYSEFFAQIYKMANIKQNVIG